MSHERRFKSEADRHHKNYCEMAHKPSHTKKAAISKAASIKKQGGIMLYIYKCPHCKYYHLTSRVQY